MINYDRRVNVYFNLHKRLFSVTQGGRVVAHSDGIALANVRFLVGKAGQDKVRRTGRKNVHAKVSGYITDWSHGEIMAKVFETGPVEWRKAYYNPYETDTFIDYADRIPLNKADIVRLTMSNAVGRPLIMYANQEI